MIVISIEA